VCGRYTLSQPADAIEALADVVPGLRDSIDLQPRFNIAPSQLAPVVANLAARAVELYRWGLVPHWADGLAIGSKMINARAEGLADRPAFRDAVVRRRCLVLADGFYEWRGAGKVKQPLWIRLEPRRLFCFAGLWSKWKPKDGGETVRTFTIITASARGVVAPFHDRMPVIVDRRDWERWLHPEPLPLEALADILAPGDAELAVIPVSPAVNSPANDGPECLAPPNQPSLF
jgi:putative SOS response-associated peptidase YedK